MASGLYEYSVSPNLNGKIKILYTILKIFNLINIIIAVFSFILAFVFDNTFWILFAIFMISIIVVHLFSKANFSAYDCIFVAGTIRIDRVHNNRRKRLISFDCKNVRAIGGITSQTYQNNVKSKQFKKINAIDKDVFNKDFYLVVDKNNFQYLITMRFNEVFLSHLLRNVNSRIVEKEYKELLVK